MTGDIQTILATSEAAQSLEMEASVARLLENHNWDAETSMYYSDPETRKPREIDVYVSQIFDRPRRRKGIGGPSINLCITCECKSLAGSNILFSPSEPPSSERFASMHFWLGYEKQVREMTLAIAEQAKIEHPSKIRALYNYIMSRAYTEEERAVCFPVSLPPPPVDIVSRSYRETKNGKIDEEKTRANNRQGVVWNAMRSCLSAREAIETRTKNYSLDYVEGNDFLFYGERNFATSMAFFLDASLLRNTYFHPFIVVRSQLWGATDGQLEKLNSARVYVSDIEHGHSYVDIVNFEAINEYISSMVDHYEKAARKSIKAMWDLVDEIGWGPGQKEDELFKVLKPATRKLPIKA